MLLVVGLGLCSKAIAAGDPVTGGKLWNGTQAFTSPSTSACAGCHFSPPGSSGEIYQLNAANNPTRISQAISPGITNANGTSPPMSGFSLTVAERDNIAAYIAQFVVTSANTANGQVGTPITNYQIATGNFPNLNLYGASGLPPGLTVNTGTGIISGTPTTAGVYSATVSASNAVGGNGSKTVTFTITAAGPVAGPRSVTVPYNTATQIDLASSITGGPYTSIAVTTAAGHGTTSVAGSVVTFTPTAGYTGADTFGYTATGPGGNSAATVSITVNTLPPFISGPATMTVPFNTATTLDLAPFIGGSGISGVSVSTNPSHGVVTVNGTRVTFTPSPTISAPMRFPIWHMATPAHRLRALWP